MKFNLNHKMNILYLLCSSGEGKAKDGGIDKSIDVKERIIIVPVVCRHHMVTPIRNEIR